MRVRIPRWSCWFVAALATACATPSGNQTPYPSPSSVKGLQVQMVDDALALGIRHAGINCNLGQLMPAGGTANVIAFEHEGAVHRFDRGYVEHLDAQIAPLSQQGVVVSLILLAIATGDPARDAVLLHPRYDPAAPNRMGAQNTATEAGRRWLDAAIRFLAHRWSDPASPHGTVWNWIVGNEVNSHWWWWNMGRASMEEVAAAYGDAVRIVHGAVRSASAHARVFVSLEHHWTIRYAAGDDQQAFAGRDFLLHFARHVRAGGDFDWHVAFHPYPEDLFRCRFWEDRTAPDRDDAPRVTFRNLPVLARFLAQDPLLHDGAPRRVILSEQGFHRADGPEGERDQAAAFAAAWVAVAQQPWIDAFILHRHVDHAHEGGLRLGLWTRKDDTICTPDRPTRMYEVFRDCDTAQSDEALRIALPVLGIDDWSALGARLGHGEARR